MPLTRSPSTNGNGLITIKRGRLSKPGLFQENLVSLLLSTVTTMWNSTLTKTAVTESLRSTSTTERLQTGSTGVIIGNPCLIEAPTTTSELRLAQLIFVPTSNFTFRLQLPFTTLWWLLMTLTITILTTQTQQTDKNTTRTLLTSIMKRRRVFGDQSTIVVDLELETQRANPLN